MTKPTLAVTIGDPCGVGPEILAKAMATGQPQRLARLLFIGSAEAMRRGVAVAGADLVVQPVASVAAVEDDPRVISILDDGRLDPAADRLRPGKRSLRRRCWSLDRPGASVG